MGSAANPLQAKQKVPVNKFGLINRKKPEESSAKRSVEKWVNQINTAYQKNINSIKCAG